MKHRLLLLLVAGIGLGGLFAADRYYRAHIERQNTRILHYVTRQFADRLAADIQQRILAVEGLQVFMLTTPELPDFETFDRYAAGILAHYPVIRGLAYVDSGRVIRHFYPAAGNEAALGLDLMSRPAAPFVEKAIRERRTTVNNPTVTVQKSLSVIARTPLYRGEAFLGLVQGVFDITALMDVALGHLGPTYAVQLRNAGDTAFWGTELRPERAQSVRIPVGDNHWDAYVNWRGAVPGPAAFVLGLIWGLGGALLISLLWILHRAVAYTDALEQAVTLKTRELEVRNSELEAEIVERMRVGESLNEETALLGNVFSNTYMLIAYLDPEFHFIRVNEAYAHADDKRPEDFPGKYLFDLYPNAENEVIYRRVVETGEPFYSYAKAFTCAGNPERGASYWDWILQPVKDEYGVVTGLVLLLIDVTQRVRTEQELRESEANLRAMAENANDGILVNLDGRHVFANRCIAEMLGYSVEELYSTGIRDLVHPDELEAVSSRFNRRLAGADEPSQYETVFLHKDGTAVPVEITAARTSWHGRLAGMVIIRDIREPRQSEQAMRSLVTGTATACTGVEFFQALVRHLAAALGVHYAFVAELTEEGADRARVVAICAGDKQLEPFTYDLAGTPCEHVIGQEACAYPEHVRQQFPDDAMLTDTGAECYLGIPLTGIGGKALGLLAVLDVRPLTRVEAAKSILTVFAGRAAAEIERMHSESKRERLQAQLQQIQKMEAIGQLTGGIAHDFNNILAAILGYTSLAQELIADQGDGKLGDYLMEIYQAGERGRDLVAQMMTYSRRGDGVAQPVDVVPLIGEVNRMLRATLPMTLEIETRFGSEVAPVRIDPVQLQQVIMNLGINARDATGGQGRMCIEVSRQSRLNSMCTACHLPIRGSFVEISVSDNGTGLEESSMNRIFEPFFTTKEVGSGTGMGLSVVHGIVHEYGGHILVETVVGAGTTFRLLLPPAAGSHTLAQEQDAGPGAEPETVSGVGGHILLVDDEPALVNYLTELLRNHGYQVTANTDAEQALGIFLENPATIDMVITDQTMPRLTGVDLAKRVLAERPGLPIILCTGYSDAIDEERARQLNITGFLSKPIRPDELLHMIGELLGPGT